MNVDARILGMTSNRPTGRLGPHMRRALSAIQRMPGCCTMDVVRAIWGDRGHAATYAAVSRLVKSGWVLCYHDGTKGRLYAKTIESGNVWAITTYCDGRYSDGHFVSVMA